MKKSYTFRLLLMFAMLVFIGTSCSSGGGVSVEKGDTIGVDIVPMDTMDVVADLPTIEAVSYRISANAVMPRATGLSQTALVDNTSWASRLALAGTVLTESHGIHRATPRVFRRARDGINPPTNC